MEVETTPIRHSDARNKIDFHKAFELRYLNGLTYEDIGKHFKCTASAIHQKLQPLQEIVEESKLYSLYHTNSNQILKLAEATLLQEILNKDKIEKASINNLAYAYDKLRQARTGQSIGNTAITIELVFQQAETAAKKLRRSSADIVINNSNDNNGL